MKWVLLISYFYIYNSVYKMFSYFTYFSMNFLWKPDLRVSLMNGFSFLSGSSMAQFLNTTSSSHRLLTLNSAGLLFNNGLPLKMFSVRILSSWAFLSASYKIVKEINKMCIWSYYIYTQHIVIVMVLPNISNMSNMRI